MQTFLPYPDSARSAAVLDRQRLGKQRVEVLQLLRVLTGESRGWRNHPAARMWSGHEGYLASYGLAVCREWLARGYRDTCTERLRAISESLPATSFDAPWWWGDERLHSSHRSCLLAKDARHYGQWGWREQPASVIPGEPWPYWWPVENQGLPHVSSREGG